MERIPLMEENVQLNDIPVTIEQSVRENELHGAVIFNELEQIAQHWSPAAARGRTSWRLPLMQENVQLNDIRVRIDQSVREDELISAVIFNGVEQIARHRTLLDHFDGIFLNKPILLHACEQKDAFRAVKSDTVECLINNGADLDYIDHNWYGWEVIHYAAVGLNPDILKVVCDKLGPNRINTLTMLSENALHILLEHCPCSQSFLVSCQNGPHRKMTKILNKERSLIIACAEILINANIDVNHVNFWNETPILIAIKRKYFQVVKLLLKRKDIDLDSCKDAVSGRSARDFLKNRNDLGILPSGTKSEKNLFHFLKSGDEENFLKCSSDKRLSVNSLDGDNEMNSSCTLLQYCFRKSLILWYHEKTTYECDLHFFYQDITANRMVQVFCQSGMARCIQHLLDNGANVDFRLGKFEAGLSVLEAAIIKGFYPLVALILGRNEDIDCEGLENIARALNELIKVNNNTTECNNINFNNTLSIVLNRLIESPYINVIDRLKVALKDGIRSINKENLLMLLKFPRILICKETKNVLEDIDPEILKTHFDDCVVRKGKDVYINCVSFLDDQLSVHTIFQNFLVSPVLSEFFNHVIFKILIMREWKHLRFHVHRFQMKYFYMNFFFHIIFYALLNLYILFKFNNVFSMFLYVSGWICLAIFIAKEVFQCLADWKLYWKEYRNYCELSFIFCTTFVYCSDGEWIDVAEVLSILSSNFVILFLLLSVPAFSKYIIILQSVVYYLRYIIFYFIQFLAFAICFYILFAKKDQAIYMDLPNKIFETIILFTGNLDYMETPWTQSNETSTEPLYHNFQYKEVFSKIIFIIFVIFIAVILQNLLVGLLFIDIANLNKNVALSQQIKRAGFAIRMETFFNSRCLPKWFKNNILQYHKMKIFRNVYINVDDRKILQEGEKLNLDFILTRKTRKPNPLKKLRNYIMTKVKEEKYEEKNEQNKEIVEKLEIMEEIIKNLHEMNELKRNN